MRSNVDAYLFPTNLYDVHHRLVIDGYDLTSHLGFNPIISATWTASQDQLATQGQIVLMAAPELRPFYRSPAVADRPAAAKHFQLEAAHTVKGSQPGYYSKVFDGRIDGVDGAAREGEVVLTCRDLMGCFLNRIIEPDEPPEAPTGKNGFLVASASLLAHLNSIRDTVYTTFATAFFLEHEVESKPIVELSSPDWPVVDTWVQYGGNLAEQLNQVVLQRGWAFHYRYTPFAAGAFVIYDPARADTGASYTVEPQEVIRVLKCTINDQDVTNVWDLIWGSVRTRTRTRDNLSIATYGRRYGSWPEDQAGQIDTQTEADRMLAAMLADTKDPVVELDYERIYFWPVELGDKQLMLANSIHFDVALDLAVVGYTHTIGPKSMRTVIRTRGTAIAAKKRWKRGSPRLVHVSLGPPSGVAPEGALWIPVTDLTPP